MRRSVQRAGVHRNTAFRWRHRFLAMAMQAQMLSGIAGADETCMRRSHKGARRLERPAHKRGRGAKKAKKRRHEDEPVCVLVMRDRSDHTLTRALESFNHRSVDQAVELRLDRGSILGTDGAPVSRRFSRLRSLVREPINLTQATRVREPAFHVQTSTLITFAGKVG